MALKISVTFLAALVGVAAAQALTARDVATGFFGFCDQTSLIWASGSNQEAIEAACSTTGNPVYYESWIELNYCFGNNNGTMGFQIE